ncbi:MAG: hypothetical protein JXR70_00215 [Spirochaetales bacterium]|nr:hypothetical protein [Spirochaetales bacterium]
MKKFIFLFLLFSIVYSCASKETPVIEDKLTLTELEPLRVTQEPPDSTPGPDLLVDVNGVIVEIEVKKGEQKFIYIKTGGSHLGLPLGTEGEIFEDETYAKLVGKFKVIEEFPGYFYCELIDLLYTIKIEQPVILKVKKQ